MDCVRRAVTETCRARRDTVDISVERQEVVRQIECVLCVEHLQKEISLRQEIVRAHAEKQPDEFGTQHLNVRQLKEQGELSDVVIVIDTRIGITCVLNRLVDLVGQETKRLC